MSDVATQFYTNTSEAWEVMLEDIRAAKISIDIEQYIFYVDSIGKQFVEVFKEKIKQGVKVRLLCDSVGSYTFYRSPLPDELRRLGIQIRFFNPISPWRITNFTANLFRDHRKVLVIDGVIGHVGGVGIQEHMADWRDTHMRFVGEFVKEISFSFQTVWNNIGRSMFIKFNRALHFTKNYSVSTNSPRLGQRFFYLSLISKIRDARKYIYLTTPYFIPDVRLFRVLQLAAKRGVDVRILVPEVADHLFVNHARESYFTLALKAGIKIYIYKPVMMHAKTAVIDDEWASAGSFNLDSLSFHFNMEVNINSEDPAYITELKSHFFRDIKSSSEVEYQAWMKRPLRKKFLELLTWPFHGLL